MRFVIPNILQILDLARIPLKSGMTVQIDDANRHRRWPRAYNPEPIADFFDIFYIGEGETVYDDLFDLYE